MNRIRSSIARSITFITLFGLICSVGHAQDDFWQSPQRDSQSWSHEEQSSSHFSASLLTQEAVDLNGRSVHQQSLTISQNLTSATGLTMQYQRAGEQRNYVLGFQRDNLSLSMMRGNGEDIMDLAGNYSGVDPYLFHGGYKQNFSLSGYAVDYEFGRLGHMQYGEATVSSSGLADRKARYLEWSNARYFARVSRFARDSESIGSGLDVGMAFGNNGDKRVALQTMELENDKRMQRLRFEFRGNKSRQYWLDFSAHQNPLYEANDDYRVMFSFRTLLGAKHLASHQNDEVSTEDVAIEDEGAAAGKKKKRGGWRRAVLIGGGIAAAAALSSSGSSMADSLTRFRTQNEAARDVLNDVNPQSIRINREFGGWVFANPDGSFGTSTPVQGDVASVRLPDPQISVPRGSRITASYHTHGAFDPRFDNENFSQQDLENDRLLMIDGYLATPLGQFKLHDIETDTIITLGTVATE